MACSGSNLSTSTACFIIVISSKWDHNLLNEHHAVVRGGKSTYIWYLSRCLDACVKKYSSKSRSIDLAPLHK